MAQNPNVKSKDIELWRTWNNTRASVDLQALLNQMKPIISSVVGKWSPSMSRSLLEGEAKRLSVEAFKDYNPNQGVALSTFVTSRLQKLSRLVYSNQNAARLSETKALLFHTYHSAISELRETSGREPTQDELADRLGWSVRKVGQFQRQAGRKEFVESEEHPDHDENADDHFVDYLYHDLTPLQKSIFEHTVGYHGAEKLDGQALMKKLNITQGQLSYQKGLIVKLVEGLRGSYNG